ncbi:MAG: alpha/beta hydrolase [Actinobacteria bacterium]|nr:alpha/beta hydrolase [Actinomycetota bacterium]
MSEVTYLRHNLVELALHRLRGADPAAGESRPLLLLHGLGERTPDVVPGVVDWPGPVHGLDFTGHGSSTLPVGGGYSAEILVGDVDAALAVLGPVTLMARGLGAYIALLAAAARPELVRGAVLADGPGLVGGGVHPGSPTLPYPPASPPGPPDPFALAELSRDPRPADYAQTFVRFVLEGSDLELPLWVAAVVRPEWLAAVAAEPGIGEGSIEDGLAHYLDVT